MKILITAALALVSISAFAGNYDRTEIISVSGSTASSTHAMAVDLVDQVNDARWNVKLPFLKTCNPSASDFDDRNFQRKAYTTSSRVTLNHVTGRYHSVAIVRCED
jgi:hypothetical protein